MKTLFTLLFFLGFILAYPYRVKAQWTQTSFTSGVVSTIAYDGSKIYAGSTNGVHVSSDNGSTWTLSQLGAGYNANAIGVAGTTIIAGTTNGGVFTSTNSAASWTQIPGGTYNAIAVSGTNIYAGTNGGVLKSTNNGATWSNILTGSIWSMAVNGSTVLTGINGFGGIRISTNDGANWTSHGLTNKNFYSFLINGSMMFAGTASGDGGLYMSSDNGANWTQSAGSTGYNALVGTGSNVFAGTSSGGVRLSTNNGISWTAVNTGLTPYDIRSLAIIGSDIYCGTYGSGIWKRPLSEMVTGIEELEVSPITLFPNPSSGKFNIVQKNNQIELSYEVSNSLGQEILKQQSNPEIDLSNSPKGIYFVRILSDQKAITKKIVIE